MEVVCGASRNINASVHVAACGVPTASAGSELLYWRDENGFYCPPMALECACMRGYQECMESNDCHQSSEDLLASLEMCKIRGCSAVQCGLAAYQDPSACQQRFIGCILNKEQNASGEEFSCRCTRQYVACQAIYRPVLPHAAAHTTIGGNALWCHCNHNHCINYNHDCRVA